MFYLGILDQLLIRMASGLKKCWENLLANQRRWLLIKIKSSNTELYPILGLCPELIDDNPFVIAYFCGTGKPDPLDKFLEPFMIEFKQLKSNGFTFENNHYMIEISFFICDTPARAILKGTMVHTSKYGCKKCTIVGFYKNHRICFSDLN